MASSMGLHRVELGVYTSVGGTVADLVPGAPDVVARHKVAWGARGPAHSRSHALLVAVAQRPAAWRATAPRRTTGSAPGRSGVPVGGVGGVGQRNGVEHPVADLVLGTEGFGGAAEGTIVIVVGAAPKAAALRASLPGDGLCTWGIWA
jgi:hypothetical protein